MNIQSIERKSELDRANIRFYEREGLISPKRLENGYRDYSEDDLSLLLKIKLLRRLGISLETIRSVINGETPLDKILADRLTQISTLRREIDAAERICTEIRENGVNFASLDAAYYLKLFDGYFSSPAITQKVFEKDREPAPGCPWRRYFARSFDHALFHCILVALMVGALKISPSFFSGFVGFVIAFVEWLICIVIESFFLSKLGTTPGKFILGIRLEHSEGRLLTYEEANQRTWRVFGRGYGYIIPVYQIIREYKTFAAICNGEHLDWNEDCTMTFKPMKWYRIVIYILLAIILSGLALWAAYAGLAAKYGRF